MNLLHYVTLQVLQNCDKEKLNDLPKVSKAVSLMEVYSVILELLSQTEEDYGKVAKIIVLDRIGKLFTTLD